MGLKNIFDAGKCLLGFHEGPWVYRTEADCTLVRTCSRCGQKSERVEHTWGEWRYQAVESCAKLRECVRCRQFEQSVEHTWGEPVYARDGACDRVAVCGRCGHREPREVAHCFDQWTYRAEDDCTEINTCKRCGYQGSSTPVGHDWTEWERSEFYEAPVRVCRQCGDLLVQAHGSPVSMRAVEADAVRLAAARTESAVRRALTGTTLLSQVSDKYFQFALEQLPSEDDHRSLKATRDTAAYCRQYGLDATLVELGLVQPPQPV